MANFGIVVIGASAGGLSALREILPHLRSNLPVPIVAALHRGNRTHDYLPSLLRRLSPLEVRAVSCDESLSSGVLYICPPGADVRITGTSCSLSRDRRGLFQPSVDLLFESAAESFGSRALAVVLSGDMHDGRGGSRRVRAEGGMVIAQHPDTCVARSMPEGVIRDGTAQLVLPPKGIADALIRLLMRTGPPSLSDREGFTQTV